VDAVSESAQWPLPGDSMICCSRDSADSIELGGLLCSTFDDDESDGKSDSEGESNDSRGDGGDNPAGVRKAGEILMRRVGVDGERVSRHGEGVSAPKVGEDIALEDMLAVCKVRDGTDLRLCGEAAA
jgi:hypothetical protein